MEDKRKTNKRKTIKSSKTRDIDQKQMTKLQENNHERVTKTREQFNSKTRVKQMKQVNRTKRDINKVKNRNKQEKVSMEHGCPRLLFLFHMQLNIGYTISEKDMHIFSPWQKHFPNKVHSVYKLL